MSVRREKIRIVCISDTHNHGPGEGFTLPKGEVLVHAGDLTNQGSYNELKKAAKWLEQADFAVKIVVAGNHDLALDPEYTLKHAEGWHVVPEQVEESRRLVRSIPGVHYLQHNAQKISIPGRDISLHVFGSPYSPDRGLQNWAFQYPETAAEALWDSIPLDTDILITHSPPAGHCDTSSHWVEGGCHALKSALARVKPKIHICGHCHEGRGAEVIDWETDSTNGTVVARWDDPGFGNRKQSLLDLTGSRSGSNALLAGRQTAIINASVTAKSGVGRRGHPSNKPIVVDVLCNSGPRTGQSGEYIT